MFQTSDFLKACVWSGSVITCGPVHAPHIETQMREGWINIYEWNVSNAEAGTSHAEYNGIWPTKEKADQVAADEENSALKGGVYNLHRVAVFKIWYPIPKPH